MSRASRHKPSSVGIKTPSPSKPPTTRTVSAPVPKSRWTPRPHDDDPTVKTHDFAYLTGVAPPTATAKFIASVKSILAGLLAEPFLLRTLLLIFGGCCSNVYTLESILTLSSSTGTLITLLQFIAIALYTLPSQLTFTITSPPNPPPLRPTQTVWFPRIKQRRVPLKQWCIFAAQFVVINVLNNAAFGYKISLPLHIILRSAGPVASMAVGYIWKGGSYSRRKVFSVGLLFFGVVLAALSDAGAKALPSSGATKEPISKVSRNSTTIDSQEKLSTSLSEQVPGFMLLSLALLLSAIMGIWSDTLYSRYGRNPAIASEQLFYGHLLSLPFFALQFKTLNQQMSTLLSVASMTQSPPNQILAIPTNTTSATTLLNQLNNPTLIPAWRRFLTNLNTSSTSTSAITLLLLNSITQIICISGVHHLSTQTSALTVSIVLNIRKVVSLLLSIWLFGNNLPLGVLVGAAVVFVGGGTYGIPDKKKDIKVNMRRLEAMERKRLMNGTESGRESKKDR